MSSYHYEDSYLKNNDYTQVNFKIKGRFKGIIVTRTDEYAIPNKVYGVLYVKDARTYGVDWYPGDDLEVVEKHRDDWLKQTPSDDIKLIKEQKNYAMSNLHMHKKEVY